MDMGRYFVTAEGLSAAFQDGEVRKNITDILHGEAPEPVVRDYLKKKIIEFDRRPVDRVDHNLIVLSGALHRMAALVHSKPANGHADTHEEVRDLRTVPRKLYRLSPAAGKITPEQMRRLISAARHVFAALQKSEVGTTKTLADATGLNRRTVENGLAALRKAGLLEDFDFTR